MDSKKYFFVGIFALVFALGFVFAISYDLVSSGQTAKAGETVSVLAFNVTNTTATTGTNLTQITLALTGNVSIGNITSVNISDGTNDYSNGSITGTTITVDVSNADTQTINGGNLTINVTLNSSATYGYAFGIDVSAITNESNVSYSALPYSSSNVSITESTAPTASSLSRSSYSRTSITTDFTSSKCSDTGATASGISTCVLSSSSGTVSGAEITGLSCGTSYDLTVTATDNAGNTATKTTSLSTQACGGGGSVEVGPPTKVHSFTKITAGVVSIVKGFDSEIGLREIEISVVNDVNNVKITVIKHDGKPAEVSVEKSGEVYQYLEIDTENLNEDLDRAEIVSKVRKSWVSGSGLNRDEVSLFKFDEVNERWNEISTVFESEDGTYYYYSSEVDSFSYFAISEKTLVEDEGTPADENTEVVSEKKGSVWIWILVILIVLVAARFLLNSKKKK